MTAPDTAVLMMGYGGPNSFDEVRPFILNIVRGRNVPPERIEAVVEQYRLIGGKSPFNELTSRQADALEKALSENNLPLKVHPGMLFWKPYVADTIAALHGSGIRHLVALIMAPHRTEASFDRYIKTLEDAIVSHGGTNGTVMNYAVVGEWHTHPLFIEAVASRVSEKLPEQPHCKLIFCAHSIPTRMNDASGYENQIRQTCRLVVEKLKAQHNVELKHQLAYQSRSGNPSESWLEPDLTTALTSAKTEGFRQVVVVPIGFVCDHVEVLYDLDVLAAKAAAELGIEMRRAGTVGDHTKFIELLLALVKQTNQTFYAKSDRN